MYNPTTWKNDSIPDIDEDNLNNIERGIKAAHDMAEKNAKNLEEMADNQMPQEYVKKAVDDYVAENNAGLATKENLERLDSEMSNEIEGRERIKWGNTPFYVMNYPLTETYKQYYENNVEKTLQNCSKIRPCPKHIGFNLKGNSRMFLYIGDMVNGEFVPDENYFITTTSAGAYNYFNPANNRILTVEEGKYFYYSIAVDDGYELIYGDDFPDTKLHADGYTPYYTTINNGRLYSAAGYDSIFIPNGCWYMILTENKPQNYERNNVLLSTTADVTEESDRYYNTIGTPSFGYIPKDLGSTILRLPDGCYPEDIQLYIAPDNVHSTCSVGLQEQAVNIAGSLINGFRFKSKKAILWSDSKRTMDVGKRFFGIPYSSRWMNSHHVGFEVSPETALNALNDEYSIAYDGGVKSINGDVVERFPSVSGCSEIGNRGGAGYGLVCSTFVSLINGCAYPQSNRGFSFDGNFDLRPTNYVVAGMSLMNRQVNHCAFIDEMFDSGYTVYEGVQPCCAKSVHTGNGLYAVNYERTRETFLDDYIYAVNVIDRSGFSSNFLEFENIEIAGGSIRPWRGNKCVYGPWDKGEYGSGIGITVHDGANIAYMVKPNGNTVNFNVSGLQYLEISDAVDQSGTYELYSDVSDVREYFRFYSHNDVILSFDANGKAIFSHDDVLYAYTDVYGYGMDFEGIVLDDYGPVVIAKGKRYKAIAESPDRMKEVYACIVEDPNEEKWGRYSVPCVFV